MSPNTPNRDPLEPDPKFQLEPLLAPEKRQLMSCLSFFLAEQVTLRDREFLAPGSFETVQAETRERINAIEQRGRSNAQLEVARRLAPGDPRAALPWAEAARKTDPTHRNAWSLAIDLSFRLRDDARGADLCEEAVSLIPDFTPSPDALARTRRFRETPTSPNDDAITQARLALRDGADADVVSFVAPILAEQPDHADALALSAFALRRMGRLAESLEQYRKLQEAQPENEVWAKWVRHIEETIGAAKPKVFRPQPIATTPSPPRSPAEPSISWSSIAGEFLQDHWQKLFLCLAVLLIVVSSNVGAYQLLGPKLWSPVGKCLLSLVYTAMFAGFGTGLVRWGAERSGRIMLLTTLFVVPADFMLAGQMKLLTEPSAWNLAVLGIDVVALFLLIRLVARSMGLMHGATSLSIALFALSIFNVAVAPGLTWPWSWQFAMFLAPSFVFMGAVAWAITRLQGVPLEGRHETTYFVLGIFVFAFLTGVIRTGVFALELPPTLYALPVIATAIACVHTARRMGKFDPEPKHEAWLRFGGLVVSGLAVTLALARPMVSSPLYSGNTFTVAVMALGLYASLLIFERHPAYLYLGFGALFLAYFGAFYFVVDLLHAIEEIVRGALGYKNKLPFPFKALNGLVLNALLAFLSLYFARRWQDQRLARHCHYIGLPLSILACVLSTFEPKAAVLCLSAYAILYVAAVRVFDAPRLLYLATATLAGAVYFGTTFLPWAVPALQALTLATLGFAYWLVVTILKARIDRTYTLPLSRSALALTSVAMVVALLSVLPIPPAHMPSFAAAAALLVGTIVVVLANREEPRAEFAVWATAGLNLSYAYFVLAAEERWGQQLNLEQYALAASGAGFVLAALGGWLGRVARSASGEAHLRHYPVPLVTAAFVQVGLSLVLCGVHVGMRLDLLTPADFATMATALAFCGGTLTLLSRRYPEVGLAHLVFACGLGVWICIARSVPATAWMGFSGYAAVTSGYALLLLGFLEAGRVWTGRRKSADPDFLTVLTPTSDLFLKSIPNFLIGVVLGAVVLGVSGLSNGPEVIFTFGAGSVAVIGSTRTRRGKGVVDLGLWLGVFAALCQTAWLVDWTDEGHAIGWIAVVSAMCSIVLWALGQAGRIGRWLDIDLSPCFRTASALSWLLLIPAVIATWPSKPAYALSVGALLTNGLALILLSTSLGKRRFTYRAIVSVVLAVYVVIFSLGKGSPDTMHVPGLVAASLGLVLSALGFLLRDLSVRFGREHWNSLYAIPFFRSALLLAILAVPISYWSPVSMGLVALFFLVMVKGIPSREWLYASVAATACAFYFAWLHELPPARLVTAAMVAAYQLWLIGLGLRRYEPELRTWLRLPGAGYDKPLYNSAIIAALTAIWLRFNLGLLHDADWFAAAGLALNLAGFCLLMIKAYPTKGWLHASVVLVTVSVGMEAYLRVTSPLSWVLIGMGLAILLSLAAKLARRFGSTLCRRFGIPDDDYAGVVQLWAHAFFTLASAFSITAVVGALLLAIVHQASLIDSARPVHWWMILASLGLGCVYVISSWGWTRRAETLMGLWGWLTLAVWWLGAPISPLVTRYGMDGSMYEPLASATLSLATVAAGVFLAKRSSWKGVFWNVEGELQDRLDAFTLQGGLALALLAAVMTLGQIRIATVGTLLIASAALGIAAVARWWVGAGYAAAVTWSASGIIGSLVAARRFDVFSPSDQIIWVALGTLISVGLLWLVAGMLRRGQPPMSPGEETDLPAGSVALALEQVGLLATLFCGGAVVAGGFFLARPAPQASMTAVGVLFGLALFDIGMIRRWRAEWLVYVAQTALVGSYLYYRWAFPVPSTIDATVLSLFGYLSLGMAELLHRLGLSRYSKATRYSSLVIPLLPIGLTLWDQGLNEANLFVLFTAAGFYGVACAQMRWRSLGYAAAVLFNAFLWLLWSRLGWQVVDHTQFFLIPIGLSAVLFAEVNRDSLGRDVVNAIRGVGLTVIYASLAVPIWQYQSFGAWVFLLFASLAGIVVGIGLRVQTFLWLGLVGFVLDVVYQLGKFGMENSLAKWSIMLALGVGMVVFVALNEKKKIVMTLRTYFETARQWE